MDEKRCEELGGELTAQGCMVGEAKAIEVPAGEEAKSEERLSRIDTDILRTTLKKFEKPEDITICVDRSGTTLSGHIEKVVKEEIPEPPFEIKRKERKLVEETIPRAEHEVLMDSLQPVCCTVDGWTLKKILQKKRDIEDRMYFGYVKDDKELILKQTGDPLGRFAGRSRKFTFSCAG